MLGRVVNARRVALGLSKEDFAERVELDRTYVRGIERGVKNPTLLVLLPLAEVLSVGLDDLIRSRIARPPEAHAQSIIVREELDACSLKDNLHTTVCLELHDTVQASSGLFAEL